MPKGSNASDISNASTKQLRDMCNNKGISCRGKQGGFLHRDTLVKKLTVQNGGVFNRLSTFMQRRRRRRLEELEESQDLQRREHDLQEIQQLEDIYEAWRQQPQQWQQEQDTQLQQKPQQFETKATQTKSKIDEYRSIDRCTYMPSTKHPPRDIRLLKLIFKMEDICRKYIILVGECGINGQSQVPWSQLLSVRLINDAARSISIKWTNDNGEIMKSKYFATICSKIAPISDQVTFKLVGEHDQAVDLGGVSRAVFSKAGDYIKSILDLDDGGRYYFKSKMPKDSYGILAGCISASINQKHVLGVPLSYGILYCIWRKSVPKLDEIGLHTLMALLKMDNPSELEMLLAAIEDIESIQSTVPYHSRTDHIIPKLRPTDDDAMEITADTRYEWLKRVIYDKLFRYSGHLNRFINNDQWNIIWADLIHNSRLEELSILLGTSLTAEVMDRLNIIPNDYYPALPYYIEFLKRYIKENPDKWDLLLKFITGSSDPHATIKIAVDQSEGLPTSSTCFNILHLHDYGVEDYDIFSRELTISLDNMGDLGAE